MRDFVLVEKVNKMGGVGAMRDSRRASARAISNFDSPAIIDSQVYLVPTTLKC